MRTPANPAPVKKFASENCNLHSCTKSNSLVAINGSVGILPVDEFLDHLLHDGNSCGTTDKNNIMNIALVDLPVTEALLLGTHGISEIIHVQLLRPCFR